MLENSTTRAGKANYLWISVAGANNAGTADICLELWHLFNMVLALERILSKPFSSLSFGTEAPSALGNV